MNAFLHESSFNYERCPEPENIKQKFKEVIRTAPRNTEWTALTDFFQYEDFWHSPRFLERAILAQEQFQARPSDIILCSAPKTGTTWLKALSFAVVNRAVCLDDSKNPLLFNTPHECVPYLEVDLFQNKSTRYPDSPLLATHLPFDSLSNSMIASDCKLVYICRDPKDIFCFSLALHRKCESQGRGEVISFGKAFELFCLGASFNGPYWDHVLGYLKASLKLPKKILFLIYEDLKRETEFYLERLAEFIGHSFSANEMREGAAGKIMQLYSFQILSKLEVNKTGEYTIFSLVAVENNKYFRKGEAVDWKICLSGEMKDHIDGITEEKLKRLWLDIRVVRSLLSYLVSSVYSGGKYISYETIILELEKKRKGPGFSAVQLQKGLCIQWSRFSKDSREDILVGKSLSKIDSF